MRIYLKTTKCKYSDLGLFSKSRRKYKHRYLKALDVIQVYQSEVSIHEPQATGTAKLSLTDSIAMISIVCVYVCSQRLCPTISA